MKKTEDKYRILKLFTPVLRETRAFPDLERIDYIKDEEGETARLVVEDPTGQCPPTFIDVDITADSGTAMLKDILKAVC